MSLTSRSIAGKLKILSVSLALAACARNTASASFPDPSLDAPIAGAAEQAAVFAGGCFWGMEAVFEHVEGVRKVTSGYAGGDAATAHYDIVGTGATEHAEAVRVRFDPAQVSYGQLLKVYFSVAHDPTQLNRQGPDTGPQYRSAIFYGNPVQKKIASAYIAQLQAAKVFSRPIATQLLPLETFYPAEAEHQDYARLHPKHPYIVAHDLPKLARLKERLPELYDED